MNNFENLKDKLRTLLEYLNISSVDAYFGTISVLETKNIINEILSDKKIDFGEIKSLIGPTGALQEISIDNGWSEAFLKIAKEIDEIIGNV